MKLARRLALLVTLWLLAWGELTIANVMSGLVVAAALLASFPPSRRPRTPLRLSLPGAARLGLYIGAQLVLSNLAMARDILRPGVEKRPAVLAHDLRGASDEVVTIMSSVIALSPGTMTVDVDHDSSAIYVHFFHLDDIDAARADLARLERFAVNAIGNEPDATIPTPSRQESP